MNYIGEINRFYDWLETNSLSVSAVALWHALMHINNKSRWIEEFAVATSVLCAKTGLSERTIRNARNELKQRGRLDWKTRGGNKSATYILIPLTARDADSVSDNVTVITSDNASDNASALYKQNNTKLFKEKSKKEKKSDFDFSLIPKEFIPIVKKWLKYKSEKNQTYKKTGFRTFCKKLEELTQWDLQLAEKIIEQSMASNYAGIFELKNKNENTRRNNTQSGKVNFNSEGDINEKARTYTDLVNTLDLS